MKNVTEEKAAKYPALMTDREVLKRFHFMADQSGKMILKEMRRTGGLSGMLEHMQTERNWRRIRVGLDLFLMFGEELTEEERRIVLEYLAGLFSNQNGAVRRMAARTAGRLLALSDWREIWKEFLHGMLFPGQEYNEQERRWIGFALRFVLDSLLESVPPEDRKAVLNIYAGYFRSFRWDALTSLALVYGILEIPYDSWGGVQRGVIEGFLRHYLASDDAEMRIVCLWLLENWLTEGWTPREDMAYFIRRIPFRGKEDFCENDILQQVRKRTAPADDAEEGDAGVPEFLYAPTEYIILEDQRLENSWLCKLVNLMILRERIRRLAQSGGDPQHTARYAYASHLLNMLRFSNHAVVRLQAGKDLVSCVPELEPWQVNDIMEELCRAIELREEAASNYIPDVLAGIYLILKPEEQKKIFRKLRTLTDSTSAEVVSITLESVCLILKRQEMLSEEMISSLTGLLCGGMACYKEEIAKETFWLVTSLLFSGREPEREIRNAYMRQIGRRMLVYTSRPLFREDAAYCAAAFRRMSQYIDADIEGQEEVVEDHDRVAFFSGTFDPFTEGHRAVVRAAVEAGFRVFLNAHDFSWKQKSLPSEIRRQMLLMAVADIPNVYLFPEELPVNPDHPEDLVKLREVFYGKEVYLMMGSDVPLKAEAYQREHSGNSVHSFPHLIFERSGIRADREQLQKKIRGEILFMQLPSYYDSMTSDRVQKRAERGDDLSGYVRGQVQNLISENNLYEEHASYKKKARTKLIDTIRRERLSNEYEEELIQELKGKVRHAVRDNEKEVLLRDERCGSRICGGVIYHEVRAADFYRECGDSALAGRLRDITCGNVLRITDVFGRKNEIEDMRMTALTEMLSLAQADGYAFAVCFEDGADAEVLESCGFRKVDGFPSCRVVDMRKPLVMIYDTYAYLGEPYAEDRLLRETLWNCRLRLQRAVRDLYPGMLVLNLDADILNHRLVQMIKKANSVADIGENDDVCGTKLCVPFGRILKGALVPNTVTKELDTEKVYNGDLSDFSICAFPHYAPIRTQIRTLHSFGRPVILVDDIYHKGFRLNKVEKYLKEEHVKVSDFVVGILSGRGRDLADQHSLKIRSAYFVPNMRAWVMVSDLYPFIGGDSIRIPGRKNGYRVGLPSVNAILPYQIPSYFKDTSPEAFYHLSEVCLENVSDIYSVLEEIYDARNHRKLTLQKIGDVITEPRYPAGAVWDMTASEETVSEVLKREMQKLRRLRRILQFG